MLRQTKYGSQACGNKYFCQTGAKGFKRVNVVTYITAHGLLVDHAAGSVLLQDEAQASGRQDVTINMDSVDRQRYQQQLQLIDEQDTYIQSRADTMHNIEQTIVELGGIFQQLAHMVKEQEEMVQR